MDMNTYEEQGESQEHVDAMIAKGEQIEKNNNPDRPEWLPEKFKDPQDMAEAYAQLEKKMGQGEPAEPATEAEAAAEPEAADTGDQPEASEVRQAVEAQGVDFDSLQNEYNEHGELGEAALQKLADAGFSNDLVKSWIQGQEALNTSYQTSVYEIVGGEESYKEMLSWAGDNLSQAEISAYDRAVDSGDIEMVKMAVAGLQAKYQTVEGADPTLVAGQSTSSSGGTYSSWAEVTTAMKDPRYESDPAYRQQVANKLDRSNVQQSLWPPSGGFFNSISTTTQDYNYL